MKETWKDIRGYEGLYQVSDLGNVRNLVTQKILKQSFNTSGYVQVSLNKNHKRKKITVHRLVLETFKPRTDMYLKTNNGSYVVQADHINNIKTDNKLKNLQWLLGSRNLKKEIKRNKFKRNLRKLLKEVE
jgi:ribosomal 30S subunit maturation factor RimM